MSMRSLFATERAKIKRFDRDLASVLRQNGCTRERSNDGNAWYSPVNRHSFSVPSNITSARSANAILAAAGLPPVFDD
jgi:hypothetical protein